VHADVTDLSPGSQLIFRRTCDDSIFVSPSSGNIDDTFAGVLASVFAEAAAEWVGVMSLVGVEWDDQCAAVSTQESRGETVSYCKVDW